MFTENKVPFPLRYVKSDFCRTLKALFGSTLYHALYVYDCRHIDGCMYNLVTGAHDEVVSLAISDGFPEIKENQYLDSEFSHGTK